VLPPFEPVSALHARPCGSVYAGPPAFTLITLLNKVSGTDLEVPFKVATTEVVTGKLRAAALTEKPAVVDPAGTVTEVGNVTPATVVPSFTPMIVPALGAGAERFTEQAEVPGAGIVPGVQVNVVSVGAGGCTASEKFAELPLRLAASTAVAGAETVATLAVKLALLAPVAIPTDAGIATCAVVLPTPNVTVTGIVAADFKLTVHVALPGVTTVLGLHDTPATRLGVTMVTVPPVAVVFITPPAAEAASGPLT
jgi:hypothetical protein